MMSLEQVQFQVNIPQVLTLAYDEPKPCKNGNSMLSFEDGRVIFLEEAEAAEFAHLGARRGDAVEFARQAVMNGKRIAKTQWSFRKTAPEPAPAQAAKPETGAVQRAVPERNNGQSITPAPSNGNPHAAHKGIPYWDSKTELLRCYADGIDVLVAARETAASKGLPVQFTGEDLRQVAATLYIDAGKDRRTPWQGR